MVSALVLLVLALAGYFLPWIVAASRGREGDGWIGLLNLLLGWTVLGWLVLLVIALTGESGRTRAMREEELRLLRQMAATQQQQPNG